MRGRPTIVPRKAPDILRVIQIFLARGEFPTWLDMEFEASVAPVTLGKIIRHLETSNHLAVTRRRGCRNRYIMLADTRNLTGDE